MKTCERFDLLEGGGILRCCRGDDGPKEFSIVRNCRCILYLGGFLASDISDYGLWRARIGLIR